MTIPEPVYWLVILVLLWDEYTLRWTIRSTRSRLDDLAEDGGDVVTDGGREENLQLTYYLDENTVRTVGPIEKFGVLEGGSLSAIIRDDDRVVLSPSTDWYIEPMGWNDAS